MFWFFRHCFIVWHTLCAAVAREESAGWVGSERSADEVRHWVGGAHGMQHRRQEVVEQESFWALGAAVPPPLDTHEKGLLFSLDTLFRTPCR